MRARYGVLAGFILLAAISRAPAQTQPAPSCKLKQLASVNLSNDLDLVFPVTLNGKPQKMSLQLATGFAALSKQSIDTLGLERHDINKTRNPMITTGGQTLTQYVSPDMMAVGNLGIPTPMLLERTSMDPNYDGYIGLPVFQAIDVELDLAARKMNLFSPQHCPNSVVYWTDTFTTAPLILQTWATLLVPMELDGKQIDVGLANGTNSVMRLSVAKSLFGVDQTKLQQVVAGSSPVWKAQFKQLKVGGLYIDSPDIYLYQDDPRTRCGRQRPGVYCWGEPDIRINIRQLEQLRLYFSFSEHLLYVTPSALAGKADPTKPCLEGPVDPVTMCTKAIEAGTLSGEKLADAYVMRASGYVRQKKYPEALADYEKAQGLMPQYFKVWSAQGLDYDVDRKDFAAMVEHLNRSLMLKADNVPALWQLGGAYTELKNYDAAIEAYDRAIKADPKYTAAYSSRCWTRALQGTALDLAMADCNEALKATPKSALYLTDRGFVYFRMGQFKQAIDDYAAALELAPKRVDALFLRGVANARWNEPTRSQRDIKAASAIEAGVAERFKAMGIEP